MADFRPETTVYLFKATGVDDYNQPFFASEGAKLGWYNAHSPKAFTEYSYQRENRDYIRVDAKAEDLRDYDMMCFQNGDGRYVFCRVEEVEFVNPNCTQISYSVDYMQTYIDVVTFGQCWVEREMQTGDWEGSRPSFNNLQPEGVEVGALTRTRVNDPDLEFTDFDAVVIGKYDEDGNLGEINSVASYPIGLTMTSFPLPKFGRLKDLEIMVGVLEGKGINLRDAIVGIFVVPKEYYGGTAIWSRTIPITPPYPTINGYTVVNAKCFTSEFFKLELSNRRGNEQELKPENFTETDNITLIMTGAFGAGTGGCMLYPQGYEGNPKDFGVFRPDDVQAAFVTDAFSSWLAQNSASLVVGSVGNIVNSAIGGGMKGVMLGGVEGAAIGAAAGATQALGETMAKLIDKSKDPAAIGGQAAGSTWDIQCGHYGFSVNWLHPYTANLRSIDQFFGKFGYRTNRYKVPNVNTRPKWNYVKTAGAVCRGPFPKKAQLAMEALMNNGVTFWHLTGGENISDEWDIAQNKE